MTENQAPIVSVRDLVVSYASSKNRVQAVLKGVDLDVHAGEVVGLVGESGCGKTTLARAIAGLAPITGGSVSWRGRDITPYSLKQRRREGVRMGLVFQDPQSSLNPRLPVWRLVTEAHALNGAPSGQLKQTALELLDKVKLPAAFMGRRSFELSGGQRQRIAIARALCGGPSLIVLDEPTSALDVTIQAQILALLAQLRATEDISLLFISHDLHVVRYLCDRVAVMLNGQIIDGGPTSTVFDQPSHPYTRRLTEATPSIHRGPEPQGHLQTDRTAN